MSVEVTEVTGVDAPGAFARLVGAGCAGRLGLGEHCVHVGPAGNQVAEAELARLRRSKRDIRVLRQLSAWVQGESEPASQLEHRRGPGGSRVVTDELGADHTRRLQPEAVTVELECPIEVADRQGD